MLFSSLLSNGKNHFLILGIRVSGFFYLLYFSPLPVILKTIWVDAQREERLGRESSDLTIVGIFWGDLWTPDPVNPSTSSIPDL